MITLNIYLDYLIIYFIIGIIFGRIAIGRFVFFDTLLFTFGWPFILFYFLKDMINDNN